ncbi:MAG: YggS family pyridoxal phosphate-dependent enzyme [Thermoanaerobaculia bacterium]
MAADLAARLSAIEGKVEAACARSGRRREEVTLIAVTKTFGPDLVEAALAAGMRDLGENRVQEAREKVARAAGRARWHLIGHLQSNKAKEAVALFDCIQTIDSEALAEKVGRHAEDAGKSLDVLIQVNVGGEMQKSGVAPEEIAAVARAVDAHRSLRLRGLMTIPPLLPGESVRPFFRTLRELRERARETWPGCRDLSMGMSDDFEVAIEEGATMIRLGRALFGERT